MTSRFRGDAARRALLICGSLNQTRQMHEISRHLPGVECWFSPFYGGPVLDACRRAGLLEFTIAGNHLRGRCHEYLEQAGLDIDVGGRRGPYELTLTCTDVYLPPGLDARRTVVVQEGILDPDGLALGWVRRWPLVPRWLAGTAGTGLSRAYARFCVASEGYRDHFASIGVPVERMVVTGIPNFDDCERYRRNDFPRHGYALACTSDARETFKRDDRAGFIGQVMQIAAGRPIIFKLHPNENRRRAEEEIRALCPEALVLQEGSAEEMIANCAVYVGQYSSTAFVALALGKEVHSYHPREELERLLPVQNRCAARNIASVCRELLATLDASEREGQPELVGAT